MQFAVHAPTAGYEDLTQWVTDATCTPATDIASRELVGRNSMWKAATTSYLEAQLTGYVLQGATPKLTAIFESGEEALWVYRKPNGRVFVFKPYTRQCDYERYRHTGA